MAEQSGQAAAHEPECTYCHVEIPSEDFDQTKQFYGDVFGWIFHDVPMGESKYVFYQTREGNVGGGLMSPAPGASSQVVNYILVNDVDAYIAKIKQAGGKIVMPKTEIPGFGWMARFTDPDGNQLAIWKSARGG